MVTETEYVNQLLNERLDLTIDQMKELRDRSSTMNYSLEYYRLRCLNNFVRKHGNEYAKIKIGRFCQILSEGKHNRPKLINDTLFVSRYMGLIYGTGTHDPVRSLVYLKQDKLDTFSFDLSTLS